MFAYCRVIYGFASRAQCERALAEAPDRTFMFRFPESKLPKPSALAQCNLVTVVKKNGKQASLNSLCFEIFLTNYFNL